MKSLISLWNVSADEMAERCSTSTTMDKNTVQGRVENEGISFLTITLPTFGKDFQYCLDQGLIADKSFLSFRKSGSCLPSFLRGFTRQIFNTTNGVLLDKPSIEAIFAIRQLTLMFSKMLLPCTPARERKAFDDYVQCDADVDLSDRMRDPRLYDDFHRMSSLLFRSLFSRVDSDIYNERIVPRHGPGNVAERLTSNGKYSSMYWTERLEEVFHFGDHLFPSQRFYTDYDAVNIADPGSEIPSRVISVPKTQKGPRIIAIEPSSLQFMQQGLLESFNAGVSGSYLRDFVGTESQIPNQDLARYGSTGPLATLDLSEASDRVSSLLVDCMFRDFPMLRKAMFACRSYKAEVPGHGEVTLTKYASMGSALCFPVEAMVFLTIIFLSIESERGHRFTNPSEFLEYVGKVRVYGDDIIIPTDYVHTCVDLLHSFGAKVGLHKSFWTGRFRESCGKEYYEGHDVSIVKARRPFPLHRQQVPEVVSLVELRNQFYMSGCWRVASWLDSKIRVVLQYYPVIQSSSSALGRHSLLPVTGERECPKLHKPLVKAHVVSSQSPRDPLDGRGALLKYFLKRGIEPSFDERHLERAGRPRTVYIKTRWVSPW